MVHDFIQMVLVSILIQDTEYDLAGKEYREKWLKICISRFFLHSSLFFSSLSLSTQAKQNKASSFVHLFSRYGLFSSFRLTNNSQFTILYTLNPLHHSNFFNFLSFFPFFFHHHHHQLQFFTPQDFILFLHTPGSTLKIYCSTLTQPTKISSFVTKSQGNFTSVCQDFKMLGHVGMSGFCSLFWVSCDYPTHLVKLF
ncbi:hypothetical protein QVD17_01672 [Tagetes erecta]|uniref:Uncharacterized protein n=1 Tax=Tagetes erecta TaxID=13708 RepID=A0AAD8L5A2_TARER|nr:hypothetical protein QVD17_01672 [Tagetes erecta]